MSRAAATASYAISSSFVREYTALRRNICSVQDTASRRIRLGRCIPLWALADSARRIMCSDNEACSHRSGDLVPKGKPVKNVPRDLGLNVQYWGRRFWEPHLTSDKPYFQRQCPTNIRPTYHAIRGG